MTYLLSKIISIRVGNSIIIDGIRVRIHGDSLNNLQHNYYQIVLSKEDHIYKITTSDILLYRYLENPYILVDFFNGMVVNGISSS